MPPTFRNYDPAQIIVSFKGVQLQGFAPGTFVRVERDEDTFGEQAGAGGDVVRVRSRNRMGKVTVILLQSSPSNDYLSARAAEDELTGIAYGEISLKNLNGATIVAGGSDAWIRKPAQIEYGAEVSNREWVFQVADLDLNVAGEVR